MKKTSLYLIEFSDGVKVGISSSMKYRCESTYNKPWCKEIIYGIVFNKLAFPREIETLTKRYFKQYAGQHSPEYFIGVSFETILSKIESLILESERRIKEIKFNQHSVKGTTDYEEINFKFPVKKSLPMIGYNYK